MATILAMPTIFCIERDKHMITYYRTKDGMADYKFSLEYQSGGGYQAFILDMPSYNGRDQDIYTTHRSIDEHGRYYVCWSKPLYTEEELKKVVALWSDLTQTYIRTGRTIDQQTQRADVIPAGVFHSDL